MKNFIQLGDKQINLDEVRTAEDLDTITAASVEIMAFVMMVGTCGIKDDKKRVEAILTQSGQIGGAMAKRALVLIANEKSQEKKEGNPDA